MRLNYTSFNACWTRFLTPQVWKEAHQAHRPKKSSSRWDLQPLLMVLLLMTWTTGNSEAERFETARAFYVACHQHSKRPGKTLAGLQQALAKLPLPVLHVLFAGVRRCLQHIFYRCWRRDGFLIMACDGSRLECPRSAELEKRLPCCSKKDSAPMLYVTALVLLPAGLLWSWCVGPGTASEHEQLRQLLTTLPRDTLLVADAFYQGYDLYTAILNARMSFLVRVSSRSRLYTDAKFPLKRFRESLVWYWPEGAQDQHRPPLALAAHPCSERGQERCLVVDQCTRRRLLASATGRDDIPLALGGGGGFPNLQTDAAQNQALESHRSVGVSRSRDLAVGPAIAVGASGLDAAGRGRAGDHPGQRARALAAHPRCHHDDAWGATRTLAASLISPAFGTNSARRAGSKSETAVAAA